MYNELVVSSSTISLLVLFSTTHFCICIFCTRKYDDEDNYLDREPVDCGADTCTGYGCNFTPYDLDAMKMGALGEYDLHSVMHNNLATYGSWDMVGNPLEPKAEVEFPPLPDYPLVVDAQRVCELYPESRTSVCGNGIVEAGEQCDDGNNVNGDGRTVEYTTEEAGPSTTRK